eukprot:gene8737-6143_t
MIPSREENKEKFILFKFYFLFFLHFFCVFVFLLPSYFFLSFCWSCERLRAPQNVRKTHKNNNNRSCRNEKETNNRKDKATTAKDAGLMLCFSVLDLLRDSMRERMSDEEESNGQRKKEEDCHFNTMQIELCWIQTHAVGRQRQAQKGLPVCFLLPPGLAVSRRLLVAAQLVTSIAAAPIRIRLSNQTHSGIAGRLAGWLAHSGRLISFGLTFVIIIVSLVAVARYEDMYGRIDGWLRLCFRGILVHSEDQVNINLFTLTDIGPSLLVLRMAVWFLSLFSPPLVYLPASHHKKVNTPWRLLLAYLHHQTTFLNSISIIYSNHSSHCLPYLIIMQHKKEKKTITKSTKTGKRRRKEEGK